MQNLTTKNHRWASHIARIVNTCTVSATWTSSSTTWRWLACSLDSWTRTSWCAFAISFHVFVHRLIFFPSCTVSISNFIPRAFHLNSPPVQADFEALPNAWSDDPVAFERFLTRWGTHYLKKVEVGGRFSQVGTTSASANAGTCWEKVFWTVKLFVLARSETQCC